MPVALLALLAATPVPCAKLKKPVQRAECERKAGHVMRALDLVEEWLVKKPKDKKAKKLRDALAAEVVVFDWFSEPEGAEVELDGEVLGPTPVTVTVDPGPHRFSFKREGFEPLERTETAISGTHPKLTAVLERIPLPEPEPEPQPQLQPEVAQAAPVAAPAQAVTAPPPPAARPEKSKAPLVLLTSGLFVALGGGVLVFTSILSLERNPADSPALIREWAGFALLGAGGAVALGAIIWLLIDRRPGAVSGT